METPQEVFFRHFNAKCVEMDKQPMTTKDWEEFKVVGAFVFDAMLDFAKQYHIEINKYEEEEIAKQDD